MHWVAFTSIMFLQFISILIFNKNLSAFREGIQHTRAHLETFNAIPHDLFKARDGLKEMLVQALEQTKTYGNVIGLMIALGIFSIFIYSLEHPAFHIPLWVGTGLIAYCVFLVLRLRYYTEILSTHLHEFMGEILVRKMNDDMNQHISDLADESTVKVDQSLFDLSSSSSDELNL